MRALIAILQHTPWWVFALFALLVRFGVQALTPRRVAVPRLLVVPLVFFAWGLWSLALRSAASPSLAADWVAFGIAGLAIGWWTTRLDDVRIDRLTGTVALPGSAVPLVRNLTIFAAKFALAVAMTLVPDWRAQIVSWDVAVSGLSAGYFAAWMLRFAQLYRDAGAAAVQPR
jgi:hypothetical protein